MGDRGDEPRIERLSCAHRLFGGLARAEGEVAGIAYLARDRRVLGLRLVRGGRDWVDIAPRTLAIDALTFGACGTSSRTTIPVATRGRARMIWPTPGDWRGRSTRSASGCSTIWW